MCDENKLTVHTVVPAGSIRIENLEKLGLQISSETSKLNFDTLAIFHPTPRQQCFASQTSKETNNKIS
jgi:hypothetical protein